LIWLDERPILAGVALGCLTFKPQFGLLFPLVLMATGRWRVFFSATATALGLAALTALLVGGEVWSVFFQSLPTIGNHIIGDRPSFDGDGVDWWNIQTWHAVARVLGAGDGIGWSIYAVTAVSLAVAMCLLWRSAAAFELKAAALASASFLATPYVMVYDATLMVVAVAFLIRHGLAAGFRRGDIGICVFALFSPLYLLVWWGGIPLLPLACTILLIWILRRALSETARPIIVEPAIAR
jgi:alpha-1,2-mannosyltransferase